MQCQFDERDNALAIAGFALVIAPLLALLIGLPLLILHSFVLSWLWQWFAVPIFGLPPLGVAECMGVLLLFNYIKGPGGKTERKLAEQLMTTVLFAVFGLGMGWLIHELVLS